MSHDELVTEAVAGAGAGIHASAIDYAKLVDALDRHIEGLGRAAEGIEIDVTWVYHAMMLLAGLCCLWIAFCFRLGTGGRVAGVRKGGGDGEDGQKRWINAVNEACAKPKEGLVDQSKSDASSGEDARTPYAVSNTEDTSGATDDQTSSGHLLPRIKIDASIPSFAEYISADAAPPPSMDSPSIPESGKSAAHLDASARNWPAFKDRGEREELEQMFREAVVEMDGFVWGLCVGDNRDRRQSGRLWDRYRVSRMHGLKEVYEDALQDGGGEGGNVGHSPMKKETSNVGISELADTEGLRPSTTVKEEKEAPVKLSTTTRHFPSWWAELIAKENRTDDETMELVAIWGSLSTHVGLVARMQHAVTASDLHQKRTGYSLIITEEAVMSNRVYEEDVSTRASISFASPTYPLLFADP